MSGTHEASPAGESKRPPPPTAATSAESASASSSDAASAAAAVSRSSPSRPSRQQDRLSSRERERERRNRSSRSRSSSGDSHGREMVGGCCVCADERGWDENPLVYCDGQGCNVAVHQGMVGT